MICSCLCYISQCNWYFSSEADSFPQSAIVFAINVRAAILLDLWGAFVYLEYLTVKLIIPQSYAS